MIKFYVTIFSILLLSFTAFPQNDDEINKNEFYGGYSYQWNNSGSGSNGFEGSYVRNVNKYVGVKANFSAAYRNRTELSNLNNGVPEFDIETKSSVYNVLGGIQIKDNKANTKLKPFAHALVGVGHKRIKPEIFCPTNNCTTNLTLAKDTATGIAGGFGGGLDIRLNKKFDLRLIKVDYNPIYIRSKVDHNVRIGVGIVIK